MARSKGRGMRKRGELALARKQIDEALVKAMANTLRNQILAILGERKGSAKGISDELGTDYWQVSYEMDVLRKAKLIERVGERRRRGATEVFYKATARAYLDPSEWPKVASPVKAGLRASLFQNLLVDAATAICEEVYDSLENAHMSWSPLIVDEQGWKDLMTLLLHTMEGALKIHEESGERLVTDDAEGIACTVSILGYPSAIKKRKVGLPIDAKDLLNLVDDDEGHSADASEGKGGAGQMRSRAAAGTKKSSSRRKKK